MAVHTSMFEKPCISTSKCTGKYDTQQVVETNGSKEVIVKCSKCKKTISKFREV
jgi:hypothetical protein